MNQITVCQLDTNGYFIGTTAADESPLEPGVYLVPGGCVVADAPDVPLGHRARWAEEGWAFEEVPQLPEEPNLTPDEILQQAIADIERRREEGLVAGVIRGDGIPFHSDDRFLVELLGMIMGYQAGVYTGTQAIRTRDNQIVQLDAAEITALAATVGAHRKAVYAASWAEKDAL